MTPTTQAELDALLDETFAPLLRKAKRKALRTGMAVQRKAFEDAFALVRPLLKAFDPSEPRGADGKWGSGGLSNDSSNSGTPKAGLDNHPDHNAHVAHVVEGLPEKLPPGTWAAVGDKVLGAAARVYGVMLRATPAAMKALSVLDASLTTGDDLKKFGYEPMGTVGSSDALRNATGISSQTAATIASHVLSRAYVYAKGKLTGQTKAFEDGFGEAATILAECLQHVSDALGLGWQPDPERIAAALRGSAGTVEKAVRGLVTKAAAHAPAGGVSVGGKDFAGGEFIPGEVMDRATDEERAKVEGKKGAPKGDAAESAAHDPVADLPDAEFGKAATEAAKGSKYGFGNNKVFLRDVYAALKERDPSLTREQFDAKALSAMRGGHLTLGRADLPHVMHPDDVTGSEIRHGNADYHFLTLPDTPHHAPDRINRLDEAGFERSEQVAQARRAAQETPHDPVSASIDAIKGHAAGTAPDRHKHIADILRGHTLDELHRIKRMLRLSASGNKADVVNKLSLRAAGMTVPTQGYSGRLLDRTGNVQIWRNGEHLGNIPADNPSAGHKERVPVEHAHATLQAMHADGSLRTPEGRQRVADMLTHQMTLADIRQLKAKLGTKGSGRKAEQVQKLLDRAGVAINYADAMATMQQDDAREIASRKPDGPATDAHAVEAADAADDKRERMERWAADKPGSVPAEEAARRAQGRADATRDAGVHSPINSVNRQLTETQPVTGSGGKPALDAAQRDVTSDVTRHPKPSPDGLVEMTDAEMAQHEAERPAREAAYQRQREAARNAPKPPPPPAPPHADAGSPESSRPLTPAGIADRLSEERQQPVVPYRKPAVGADAVHAAHATATGPAKRALENALWNSGHLGGDEGKPRRTKPTAARPDDELVQTLGAEHDHAHRAGDRDTAAALQAALAHLGATPAHAAGDEAAFDPAHYTAPAGVGPGDRVRVVVPALVRGGRVARKGEALAAKQAAPA